MDELARIFPSEFRGDLEAPKCLYICFCGVVGKFQPLRMGFDSYPSSEAYFVDFGGYQRLLSLEKVADLLQGKVRPLVVQLGGKIYAIAVAGSNILVSSSYTPTFRFNTADPTKGWRELSLSDGGKFEFHGTTLVVDTGHHSLLFAYGGDFRRLRLACHLTISVHMMSNTFDFIVPIAPLRLPEDELPDEFRIYPPDGYTFLDLGDGTICLLLSRFMGPFSKFEHETAKMILLLVKFQMNTTENKVKFLATHTIEYRHSEKSSAGTEDIEMMGAFCGKF